MKNEIGRPLKVSELKPRTVVVLGKPPNPILSTMWVYEVRDKSVVFTSGVLRGDFIAMRSGPDLEELVDNSGSRVHVYEYLGEI
jgi:hypothetical protein